MQLGPSYWNETVRDYQLRRTSEILRGPLEWSLDLTNQCVGKCLHCFNRSGRLPRDEMDDHTVLQVIRQIAEIRPLGLCLCGGEPLLRSGLAYRVVELLSDAKVLVNMVTSGALVTPEVACNLKNSGIKMVQISLDGASAESHDRLRQKPGAFKLAVQALMYLKEAGITTSVAFSPTRFNTEEFAEVIALSERLSVTDLRIQPLMPMGEALFHWEEIVPSPAQYQRLVGLLRERACETGSRLKIIWGDPVDHLIRFGQFYGIVSQNLHITAEGFLTPSVYLPLFVGNVRRHSLETYWRAGLSRIWDFRLVREFAFRIRSISDMANIKPLPFIDPPILLDLVEDSPEKVEFMTEAALKFIRSADRLVAGISSAHLWK